MIGNFLLAVAKCKMTQLYCLLLVAPGGQVIECTGKYDAEWSGLERSIADKSLK